MQADRYTLGGLSAHADQAALIAWLKHFTRPPRQVFIVHGEQAIAQTFAEKINQELGWKPTLPALGNAYLL